MGQIFAVSIQFCRNYDIHSRQNHKQLADGLHALPPQKKYIFFFQLSNSFIILMLCPEEATAWLYKKEQVEVFIVKLLFMENKMRLFQ